MMKWNRRFTYEDSSERKITLFIDDRTDPSAPVVNAISVGTISRSFDEDPKLFAEVLADFVLTSVNADPVIGAET